MKGRKTKPGDKIGSVEVLKELEYRPRKTGGLMMWYLVRCKCGTEFEVANYRFSSRSRDKIKCIKCSYETRRTIKIGDKYDRLTVISYVNSPGNKNSRVKCICDCGNEKIIIAGDLKRNKTCNCGCGISPIYKGINELSGRFYSVIRSRAKLKGHEFSVSLEFLYNLYLSQNKQCALTGLPLEINKRGRSTASLDRKDSSIGYTHINVQWVHRDINKMKMDLDENRFFDLCRLVTKKAYGIE